jgi:hypothetical protein
MDLGGNAPSSWTPPVLESWELRMRQWGVGLTTLGLVGLTLPLFGLQLRRLRNLGDAQWMFLCAVTVVGCCLFAYTWRRNLLVAVGASVSALLLMMVLALASFGPRDRQGILEKAPAVPRPSAQARKSPPRPAAPSPAPAGRSAAAAAAGSTSREAQREEPTRDPVELTRRTVRLLERTRDLLRDVVDVPSAVRASRQLKSISQERDEVVQLLEQAKTQITAEQNLEIGRLHGQRLGQLAGEVAAQLLRINSIPGASDALQGFVGDELEGKVADGVSPTSSNAAQPLAAESRPSIGGIANTSRVVLPDSTVRPLPDFLPPPEAQVPLPPLPAPSVPLPALTYASSRVQPSRYLGSPSGTEFIDVAPRGGILVGLILSKGTNWGGALRAVQPIYQVEDRYELGQRHGLAGGSEVRVLARPGYAVAGLRVRSGLVLDAVQVLFMRWEGKRLISREAYESDWVGGDGGGPAEFFAEGRALAGVFGRYNEDLHGLGVGVIPQLRVTPSTAASSDQPRSWRSADGQYTITATLVEVADDNAVLRREDGQTVKVPVSRLSTDDQQYLRNK